MVASCPDWCISRQRTGACRCHCSCTGMKNCIAYLELMEEVAKRVKLTASGVVGSRCEKSSAASQSVRESTGYAGYGFDSGSTHSSVVDVRQGYRSRSGHVSGRFWPAPWLVRHLSDDLYDEGQAPYRQVLTRFTVDGQSRKISKSISNTVSAGVLMNKARIFCVCGVASTGYTGKMARF